MYINDCKETEYEKINKKCTKLDSIKENYFFSIILGQNSKNRTRNPATMT